MASGETLQQDTLSPPVSLVKRIRKNDRQAHLVIISLTTYALALMFYRQKKEHKLIQSIKEKDT